MSTFTAIKDVFSSMLLAELFKGMKLRTFPNEMMRWSLEAMGFTIQILSLIHI